MAKKYAPTPEQQDVINTTDRTVLLSAAAGSGKTATLTERLISLGADFLSVPPPYVLEIREKIRECPI